MLDVWHSNRKVRKPVHSLRDAGIFELKIDKTVDWKKYVIPQNHFHHSNQATRNHKNSKAKWQPLVLIR